MASRSPILRRAYARLSGLSADNRALLRSFTWLSALQGINYFLPLLTVPYLTRVLGPERYGLVGFAAAVMQYLVTLSEYGFNLSATRAIAIQREDSAAVSRIFSNVMAAKSLLAFVGFLVLAVLVLTVPRFNQDAALYLFTTGTLVGSVLFPLWYFQGMQRMEYITIATALGRVIFTVAVFVFVKDRGDYMLVPILTSIGAIATSAFSLWVAIGRMGVRLTRVSIQDVWCQLVEGWSLFLSLAAVSVYTAGNAIILGLLAGNEPVGYYTAAEKLVRAVRAALQPVSQSLYPHVNRLAAQSRQAAVRFLRKTALLVGGVAAAISVTLFIGAAPIVNTLLGSQFGRSVAVVRILALVPFLVAMSNLTAIQGMLPFGMNRQLLKVFAGAGVVSLVLSLSLVPLMAETGTAVSWLVTEAFVLGATFFCLERAGYSIARGRVSTASAVSSGQTHTEEGD